MRASENQIEYVSISNPNQPTPSLSAPFEEKTQSQTTIPILNYLI